METDGVNDSLYGGVVGGVQHLENIKENTLKCLADDKNRFRSNLFTTYTTTFLHPFSFYKGIIPVCLPLSGLSTCDMNHSRVLSRSPLIVFVQWSKFPMPKLKVSEQLYDDIMY